MPTIHEQQPQLEAFKRELEAGGEMSEVGVFTIKGAEISGDGTSWIEVMPAVTEARNGPYFFTITKDDLGLLVADIQANPDRISIDYDHAGAEKGDTRAAGWYTGEAQVVLNGEKTPYGDASAADSAWAKVKWTPKAIQEIRDGEFRFVSAEWAMTHKDPKTGLWTKFKELAASTLTNRPFFKGLAAVTAKELDPEKVEAVTAEMGEDIAELVLRSLEVEDTHDMAEKLIAAVWTTAYINDLPDSSFLYIEAGGTKDSDGKTTPRSLRHFPVKDASGSPDMAHVRNALARIPQSNVPADAKASATAKCQRMLRDMGGNPSAADQGNPDDPKEIIVADEQPVTDYMKMLGLDDTVDPKHRLAAAFRDKDEKILALETKVTELTASGGEKSKQAEELASRVEELEQKDRQRDIEVILSRAVEGGRVLPAEKETLAEVFAADVTGLKRMIASRPREMFVFEAKGTGSEPDRYADEPDVQQYTKTLNTGGVAVDTEQAKQHLVAMQLLKDRGKAETYTDDEYVEAYEQAKTAVY
jgi:phage I-like protein